MTLDLDLDLYLGLDSEDINNIITNTFTLLSDKYIFDNEAYLSDLKTVLHNCIKKICQKKICQKKIKVKQNNKTEYINFLQTEYNNIKKDKKISLSESQVILKGINETWRDNIKQAKKKGTRKLSGYNLFYKENMKALMKTKPNDICIMKHISNVWNSLDIDTKKLYNKAY